MNNSIVLTVHNKGFLIGSVLESIKKNTTGLYELIIVIDGCTDNSKIIIDDFCKKNKNIKTIIIETPDIFETKANNVGLSMVNSEIAIIVQDDMILNEYDWNKRLTKPFYDFDDVFAVTANCAHNWVINPSSKHINSDVDNDYEWSDILFHVDHANRNTIGRDIFGIRQSVNRGPLALNYADLKKLNFFDEQFAPLDMDDHDLCYRMMREIGKVVGCYWIDYISKPEWGGTRIDGRPAPWQLMANQKNTKIVYDRHKELIKNKIINNRICQ